MPETHDWGNRFFYPQRLTKEGPRIRRAPTFELDEPYRVSNSLVVRLWGTYGLVLGHWVHTELTDDQSLQRALQAGLEAPTEMPEVVEDIADHYRAPMSNDELLAQAQAARMRIAAGSKDPTDEWFILQLTGLDQ